MVTEPADSIFAFPESRAVELSEVPAVRIAGAAAGRAAGGAVLLAAVRVEDGLELVFSKVLAEEVRVLASVRDEFDSWTEAGVVPSGAASHVMAGVNVPGGSRVRSAQGETEAPSGGSSS